MAGVAEEVVDRAEGCLLGLCVGDAWGAPLEFRPGPLVAADGYRTGVFGTPPGSPTDDSTLALHLAEHLAEVGPLGDGAAVPWQGYVDRLVGWVASSPPDVGGATRSAASAWAAGGPPAPDEAVQGNGSLMAVAPVALAFAGRPDGAAAAGRAFAALTHPSSVAAATNAAFCSTIAALVAGQAPPAEPDPEVPVDADRHIGWCRVAWACAVAALRRAEAGEAPLEALRWVIARGGDTDTNAAVAGALLGAAHGRAAWEGWPLEGLTARERATALARVLVGA